MSEILLDLKSYVEYGDYFRSQTLILNVNCLSWWVKVTLYANFPELRKAQKLSERRRQFHQFVKAIDYSLLRESFFDDTVTEIALTLSEDRQNLFSVRDKYRTLKNPFIVVASKLHCDIREDPRKITYPTVDQVPDLAKFNANELEIKEWISPTVFKISFGHDMFAYKRIDRPIYEPGDTKHILEEIKALAELRGEPNVAQIVGIVISENPYKTCPSAKRQDVITGLLLKYYPGGPLERIIDEKVYQDDSTWVHQALQIGEAIESLHERGRTHLDIKLPNIVLDAERNAILIDISGSGGYEYDWLSPEMQTLIEQDDCAAPADMPLETRVNTDCWAYGKLLLAFAEQVQTSDAYKQLSFVANGLMSSNPETQIILGEAIRVLAEAHASYIGGSS